ncbi:hydrogenase nickel incorporation protein HypB [Candidatus Woesearchaeota archaeon]|nr:hydrogenase nickel incorporation protein HypB [Candidatus Woesearchaeota archaeon]
MIMSEKLDIDKSVLSENDKTAYKISEELKENKILAVNVMGSPGSGKTTFIEKISDFFNPEEIFVIQGDLESDVDKKRMEKKGIDAYQINTHGGCHLNADMIKNSLENIDLKSKNFLFIENVGNLVCPAGIRIGQHLNVVVSSTTEGSDKPKKYPVIFLNSDLVLISKYDLSDVVDFNENKYLKDIRNIKNSVKILKISKNDKKSIKECAEFINKKRRNLFNDAE